MSNKLEQQPRFNPTEETQLQQIEGIVRDRFSKEATGHDWYHTERVRNTARYIAEEEERNVDFFVVEGAALLHDVADWKFHDGNEEIGPKRAEEILRHVGAGENQIQHICRIVHEVSFKGAGVDTTPTTKEGMIVQDADRLDALGAIGIGRVFAYGGFKGTPLYDPTIPPKPHGSFAEYKTRQSSSINHFYEKLLLLTERMNTNTARKIAQERHAFMKLFLEQFFQEWEGKR